MSWLIWVVAFNAMVGALIGVVAERKGLDFGRWFLYGFLVWPVALVHLVMAGPGTKVREHEAVASGEMKKCPSCAELVRREAIKCRFCGSELPPVSRPAARVAATPAPSRSTMSLLILLGLAAVLVYVYLYGVEGGTR